MFSKSELQTLDLCLMVQISEMKAKLKFYNSCRMFERVNSCRNAIRSLEQLREKILRFENEVKQIEFKKDLNAVTGDLDTKNNIADPAATRGGEVL